MKQFGIALLLIAAATAGYLFFRQGEIRRLDSELQVLRDKAGKQQAMQKQLDEDLRLLAGDGDMASFVENLYTCARQAGLSDLEVTTAQRRDPLQSKRSRTSTGSAGGAELKTSRLQVVIRGDYRSLAEYLRLVDGIARPKQVNRLEMTAEGPAIRMLMLIDLFSLQRTASHAR